MSRPATGSELHELLEIFSSAERHGLLPEGEAHRVRLALGRAPSADACFTMLWARRPWFRTYAPIHERAARLECRVYTPEPTLTDDELEAVRVVLDDMSRVAPPGHADALDDQLSDDPSYARARWVLFEVVGVVLTEEDTPLAWKIARRAAELDEELLASVGRRSPILAAGAA